MTDFRPVRLLTGRPRLEFGIAFALTFLLNVVIPLASLSALPSACVAEWLIDAFIVLTMAHLGRKPAAWGCAIGTIAGFIAVEIFFVFAFGND